MLNIAVYMFGYHVYYVQYGSVSSDRLALLTLIAQVLCLGLAVIIGCLANRTKVWKILLIQSLSVIVCSLAFYRSTSVVAESAS